MWISELLRWVSVSIGKDAIVPIYCLGKRRVLGPLLQTVCRSRRMKASSFPCEVGNHEGRIRKNGHSVPYPSLVIPARRGVFTSWNQPNGSFRSSEFKYTSILSPLKKKKKLEPLERETLRAEKLRIKLARYGPHVCFPGVTLQEDIESEKFVSFDHHIHTDAPYPVIGGHQRVDIAHYSSGENELNSAKDALKKYFSAKNDWQERVMKKEEAKRQQEEEEEHKRKYRKANVLTFLGKSNRNVWQNSLRFSHLNHEDDPDPWGPKNANEDNAPNSPIHVKEKEYLTFPGTNRLVRKDLQKSYRVQQIWKMKERRLREMARKVREEQASEFALSRQKEAEENRLAVKEKTAQAEFQGETPLTKLEIGFKEKRRTMSTMRRKAAEDKKPQMLSSITSIARALTHAKLSSGWDHWNYQIHRMKVQTLFTRFKNFKLYLGITQWVKFTMMARKTANRRLLRLHAMTQMESSRNINEKRMRGVLKMLLNNVQSVLLQKAWLQWDRVNHTKTRVSKRLTLLQNKISQKPKKQEDRSFQDTIMPTLKKKSILSDDERIAAKLKKMDSYFVEYENFNRVRSRSRFTKAREPTKEYFDKKALQRDRQLKVEQIKPFNTSLKWTSF